jgi:cell division protein ZapE
VAGREVRAIHRANGIAWFSFETCCEGNRSQDDYLYLAARFHTLMLSGVLKMSGRYAQRFEFNQECSLSG